MDSPHLVQISSGFIHLNTKQRALFHKITIKCNRNTSATEKWITDTHIGSHALRVKRVYITLVSHERTWANLYQYKWLRLLLWQLIMNPTTVHTHTHAYPHTPQPNRALVSSCRQETDGLLGKEAEKGMPKKARVKKNASLPLFLSPYIPPSIISSSSVGRKRTSEAVAVLGGADQRALAPHQSDGVLNNSPAWLCCTGLGAGRLLRTHTHPSGPGGILSLQGIIMLSSAVFNINTTNVRGTFTVQSRGNSICDLGHDKKIKGIVQRLLSVSVRWHLLKCIGYQLLHSSQGNGNCQLVSLT